MKPLIKKSPLEPIQKIFRRFHLTIFFVVIVAGLGGAVLWLNSILSGASSAEGYTSTIGAGSIDQATLERIKALHTSNEAQSISLPEGRTNPFAE